MCRWNVCHYGKQALQLGDTEGANWNLATTYAKQNKKICFTTSFPGGKRKNLCDVRRPTKQVTFSSTIRAFGTTFHRLLGASVAWARVEKHQHPRN